MEILILAGLILVNGVFAMSEVALLTARMPRLSALANQGDALATAAVKLSKEPTRFLSTIQIGITVIGLLNGIVGEAAFAPQLSAWFQSLGLEPRISSITATAVVVIAVTYFSIVIGELVPKRLGQHNAEDIARLVAWPMRSLAAITGPFVRLLSASTDALLKPLLRLLGIRHQESGSQPLSLEEIRTIVLESSNVLPKKHMSILVNLFDLEAVTVDDVMVPRSQIEAINLDAPLEELAQQIATAYHRRLLVYDGRLDEIVGTLRVRNALTLMQRGELRKETLREIVREPYFIPSGTALFSPPLQTRGFVRQSDGSYLIEGGALLRELNRKLGFHFPLDGPKTLNGLVLEHLRDIPEPNTSLKIADHYLEIVQTQDRVVKAVRVLAPSVEKSATGS
ncbi:MAG: hypothetical protein K0R53_3437 [Burkholderiales bacterium]|nr:hypothetical protein [Burkholderiales bacterium]